MAASVFLVERSLAPEAEELRTATGTLLALIRRPGAHSDLRGSVRETFRLSWFPEVPQIRQLVQSNSRPQTLRGMHLHRKQWDVWRFTSDEAFVRLYAHDSDDQRFITADKQIVLAIPPGVSHGFYTKSGCTLVYALTEEWTGHDEFGWYPFDGMPSTYGAAQVRLGTNAQDQWPRSHAGLNISERDLRAPRLADFK